MRILPDVLGLLLEDALKLLNSEVIAILVYETYAPYMKEKTQECRVVKQVYNGDHIELTVCYF